MDKETKKIVELLSGWTTGQVPELQQGMIFAFTFHEEAKNVLAKASWPLVKVWQQGIAMALQFPETSLGELKKIAGHAI